VSTLETRKTSLASDISPAFLLSGFLAQAPAHGYELHQKITLHLGRLWRMSLSQTYSTLKRLEAKGWIRGEVQEQASLPAKCAYSLTAKGRENFEVWLSTPTPASARAIRVEFLTRLFFSSERGYEVMADLVSAQEGAISQELARLEKLYAGLTDAQPFNRLATKLRTRQLETILDWLSECRIELNLPGGSE
jgi:DNA-binding PadR family transcriptional regulator